MLNIKKSDAKKALDEKRENSLLKFLSSKSNICACIWNVDTSSLVWLEDNQNILGHDKDSDLPFTYSILYSEFIHTDDRHNLRISAKSCIERLETVKQQLRFKNKNNEFQTFNLTMVPYVDHLQDEEIKEIYLIFEGIEYQISENHDDPSQAETPLNEVLAGIGFKGAATGMAILSKDNSFLVCNEVFLDLLGRRHSQVSEVKLTDLVHPDDLDLIEQNLSGIHDSHTKVFDVEIRLRDSIGYYVWFLITATSIHDEQKNKYIVINSINIDDKRHLQTKEKQVQKMEALGYMAGGIAHELNNIMQPINTAAQLLDKKIEAGNTEKLNVYTSQILTSIKKASAIIDDVLNFARAGTYDTKQLVVHQAVLDAINFTATIIPEGTKLTLKGFENTTHLRANINNSDMIKITTNLIQNSCHAIGQNGFIEITYSETKIDKDRSKKMSIEPGQYAVLSFYDNGQGISEEDLKNIFDPFFTTKKLEGTGLGLTLVFNIVEKQWNGRLMVSSTYGEGTEFRIYIPTISKLPD